MLASVGDDEGEARTGVTLAELFAHFLELTFGREQTRAALSADAELDGECIDAIDAVVDRFADLRLGDALADADVHAEPLSTLASDVVALAHDMIVMQMRIVRNIRRNPIARSGRLPEHVPANSLERDGR